MTKIIEVQLPGGRIEQFANLAAAEMYCKKTGAKLTANSAIDKITSTDAMPVRNPATCALLGLSTIALQTNGEIEAGFAGNGRKSSPRNTEKIVASLVNFWRAKTGDTVDETIKFLQDRHPLLFQSSLAKTAGTANERLACNEILSIGPTMKNTFN